MWSSSAAVLRISLLWLLAVPLLYGATVEPDEAYWQAASADVDLILSGRDRNMTQSMLQRDRKLAQIYRDLYGYRLDDTLHQTLASSHNQIANAFSTQIPLNMQVLYPGGVLMPDYFATRSWLENILIHESAHNYQLNAKRNPLNAAVHKIVKNTPVTSLWIAPVFPVPNLTESPFILEGNAVLNESIFGNGGRLYNGVMRALAVTQARAGLITPERCFNSHLYFPYGTHHYIVGGFFQLFLAQRYGIGKVDRYFLAYSDQWLPFFDNAVFRAHYGESFETLLNAYNAWLLKENSGFVPSEGRTIVRSQSRALLNSDADEIFFLVSDARSAPSIVRFDKRTRTARIERSTHPMGRLFRIGSGFYALASARTARDRTEIALFDGEGRMLPGTASRALQAITPQGVHYYFDVNRSLESFALYRDGTFLGRVHSSVVSDAEGNCYYFRQSGKRRTLYRNATPLFGYGGYFGKVADIDSAGRVLFVADSAAGATLYRWSRHGGVERVLRGDDIVDARLIDDGHVVAEVIRADGLEMLEMPLHAAAGAVYTPHYFFEGRYSLDSDTAADAASVPEPKRYVPLRNLRYSALSQHIEAGGGRFDFDIAAAFSDPLERNTLSIYTSSLGHDTVAGIRYDNSAYALRFGLGIYGVIDHDDNVSDRGYGIDTYLRYPWLRHTYRSGDLQLDYHLDSDRHAKSPLSLRLAWQDRRQFGYALYPDSLREAALFGVDDRGDHAWGASGAWTRRIASQLYLGAGLHYARSDAGRPGYRERGILIDDTARSRLNDPSRFTMPSLQSDRYVRSAFEASTQLSKVFEGGVYFYSLPLSLRRETLYGAVHYYDLGMPQGHQALHEYRVGMTLELLAIHKIPVPVTLELLQNDDLKNPRNFRLIFDLTF